MIYSSKFKDIHILASEQPTTETKRGDTKELNKIFLAYLICKLSALNGGHSGRKNLSEMGIYRGYFQKSDVKIRL